MRQRKSHGVLLAVILVMMLVLQACAGGGNEAASPSASEPAPSSPASSESSSEPSPEPSGQKLEPYEVSIVYFGTPQADDALVEEKLNEFFKEKINATVKLMPIASSDYKNRTELMMNTGEKMDLVFTASWLNFFGNVSKGAFLELDDLLEQYGQGIKERLNPLYLEAPRMKGKLYAIPTNKEITQGKAFTFRKDIVDKYQIPIETIKQTTDLEPWLDKIKKEEPDFIPYYVDGGSGNFGGGFMMYETRGNYRPIGPTLAKQPMFLLDYTSTSDMKVKSVLDPEIVAINVEEVEMFRDFYEKGYINSDAGTSTTLVGDLQKQGKIWVQSATWKPGADIEFKINANNEYDYVSQVVEEPIVTTDLAAGSMFSISRTSKDPDRAMMVLNYLHTDPYVVNLIVNGIEGKHYNKVGDNRIEPIADSGYGGSALFWVIGNQLINYLKPGQPDDLYESWERFNNEAKRFPLMGFVFDDSNVKNELTQMTAVVTEYKSIYTGAVKNPTKLLEERNGKLKAAGIEKVQAELQSQIDAWWAENRK
ncbi:ABC transporter substrate-binding protein [Cohnella cellulosilytica]|uniref:ABC transporter substrate-binding protein n=1 Tax=Cohnella cellulosilytica TaxID=986710 RepID=A0ABW2FD71_9BACL